ncbi:heavy metal-binding domain-containing protein [Roseobacter sp. A03A-229]
MILTTKNGVEGRDIAVYKGIIVGKSTMGKNIARDAFAAGSAAKSSS